MNEKMKDKNTDFLFRAIMSLESIEECYDFFEDLCTIDEVKEMSKRLLVAKMLNDKMVYSEISEKTGLSTATISRVNKGIKYGDGYTKILERLKDGEN